MFDLGIRLGNLSRLHCMRNFQILKAGVESRIGGKMARLSTIHFIHLQRHWIVRVCIWNVIGTENLLIIDVISVITICLEGQTGSTDITLKQVS